MECLLALPDSEDPPLSPHVVFLVSCAILTFSELGHWLSLGVCLQTVSQLHVPFRHGRGMVRFLRARGSGSRKVSNVKQLIVFPLPVL